MRFAVRAEVPPDEPGRRGSKWPCVGSTRESPSSRSGPWTSWLVTRWRPRAVPPRALQRLRPPPPPPPPPPPSSPWDWRRWGVYGVSAQVTRSQVRDIGIKVALGASSGRVPVRSDPTRGSLRGRGHPPGPRRCRGGWAGHGERALPGGALGPVDARERRFDARDGGHYGRVPAGPEGRPRRSGEGAAAGMRRVGRNEAGGSGTPFTREPNRAVRRNRPRDSG